MKPITRRLILRGVGATIGLPLLESLPVRRASAAPPVAGPPTRLAYLYVPNGVDLPAWTPGNLGPLIDLPFLLEPLHDLRDDLLVLSGLALSPARALGDGGGDHARAMSAFLTCRHPRKTGGNDLRAGISIDQVAAARIGQATRLASLEIGCEGGPGPGSCDHGYSCAYQTNLSWRGEASPATKETDPRLVFERLFGSRLGDRLDPDMARRQRRERSILDAVAADARRLRGRLNPADGHKLDDYLTGVRELELRIDQAQPTVTIDRSALRRPTGQPSDYREHLRLMNELLVLAFQADLTRVATYVLANDGSNRSYGPIGVPEGHHDLSHHGQDPEKLARLRLINRFHVEQYADLLRRLRAVPEGEGILLDHCMIVYGSGISDGNAHRHEDLPILVGGKGGGSLSAGRHLRLPAETPLANLHLSLIHRLGISTPSFGDSTGPLPELNS